MSEYAQVAVVWEGSDEMAEDEQNERTQWLVFGLGMFRLL